jgi:hypothetical protein
MHTHTHTYIHKYIHTYIHSKLEITDSWIEFCSFKYYKMQDALYVGIAKAPFKLVEQGFRVAK